MDDVLCRQPFPSQNSSLRRCPGNFSDSSLQPEPFWLSLSVYSLQCRPTENPLLPRGPSPSPRMGIRGWTTGEPRSNDSPPHHRVHHLDSGYLYLRRLKGHLFRQIHGLLRTVCPGKKIRVLTDAPALSLGHARYVFCSPDIN